MYKQMLMENMHILFLQVNVVTGWRHVMIDFTVDHKLFCHIRQNLDRFDRRPQSGEGLQKAAVALAVVDSCEDPKLHDLTFSASRADHGAIILTRRSADLRHHAGQWALPGGRIEAGERAEETVLRELGEEVGLQLTADRVMGSLDDYCTRSGFTITPVVVWGGTDVRLTANPGEVDSVHRIPLAELMRDDAPVLQDMPGSDQPVLFMPIGNSFIAAPTAAMIYQFREVALAGQDTRVAHFEQPLFAWR
jgi:mutator protein MutT